MEILETSLGAVPVLRVTGEIDHGTSPVFAEAATKVLRPDSPCLRLFPAREDASSVLARGAC